MLTAIALGGSAYAAVFSGTDVATDPWIASDKPDYAAGETVALSGGNWQSGEAVHIFVEDNQGRTWEHNADLTANEGGEISHSFVLPDWFVATYQVSAVGELSGTAQTSFTDAPSVTVTNVAPNPMNATHSALGITWSANAPGTFKIVLGGGNMNCGSGTEVLTGGSYPTANATVTTSVPASAIPDGSYDRLKVCLTGSAPSGSLSGEGVGQFNSNFTKDTVAAPPTLASNPVSPSNNQTPTITGTSEGNSSVRLYAGAGCAGAPIRTATAANGGAVSFSPAVTVTANSSTTFSAAMTDTAGNTSGCSATLTYVHDNINPAAPAITATTPASPGNARRPVVSGSAEASATVRIYTNSGCTTQVGLGTADGSGAFSITLSTDLAANATTNLFARATDAAANISPCSSPGFPYTHDSVAATLSLSGTTPSATAS
ncbi:MAG: Ig-like domain-containing protein, partial [Gaiellaceae bacterium]